MRSAPYLTALTDGSCAINGCEPCQVGNQAALSSMFDVPRGSLSRAGYAVNAYRRLHDFRVYDLIMRLNGRGEANDLPSLHFLGGEVGNVSGTVQEMASRYI